MTLKKWDLSQKLIKVNKSVPGHDRCVLQGRKKRVDQVNILFHFAVMWFETREISHAWSLRQLTEQERGQIYIFTPKGLNAWVSSRWSVSHRDGFGNLRSTEKALASVVLSRARALLNTSIPATGKFHCSSAWSCMERARSVRVLLPFCQSTAYLHFLLFIQWCKGKCLVYESYPKEFLKNDYVRKSHVRELVKTFFPFFFYFHAKAFFFFKTKQNILFRWYSKLSHSHVHF